MNRYFHSYTVRWTTTAFYPLRYTSLIVLLCLILISGRVVPFSCLSIESVYFVRINVEHLFTISSNNIDGTILTALNLAISISILNFSIKCASSASTIHTESWSFQMESVQKSFSSRKETYNINFFI
jgi:hypothetical protein